MNKIIILTYIFLMSVTNIFAQSNLGRHFNKRYITNIDSLVKTDSSKYIVRSTPLKLTIDFYSDDDICETVSVYYLDIDTRKNFYDEISKYSQSTSLNHWKTYKTLILYENNIFYFIFQPLYFKTNE